MQDMRITKLSDTEFRFEYEHERESKDILGLAEFEHEGQYYKVLRIVPGFDTPGYFSYLVIVKPA